MKIVVGLGNPGPKYETTRHNAGFLAIDRLVEDWGARGPDDKFEGEVFEASLAGEKILLVKPQTFMNLSGQCVAPLAKFFKVPPDDIIVIHDEADLKPFQLRIKTGGGTAGHNGLKSLDASLGAGATNYHRIRIGVGKPLTLGRPGDTADFLLSRFSDEELGKLDELLGTVKVAAERMIKGDVKGAMTEFNRESAEKREEKK
jgi:PTH1 family peptidyl-tRNA hydrolase